MKKLRWLPHWSDGGCWRLYEGTEPIGTVVRFGVTAWRYRVFGCGDLYGGYFKTAQAAGRALEKDLEASK